MKHYVATTALLAAFGAMHWAILSAQAAPSSEEPLRELEAIPDRIAEYERVGTDVEVDEHTKRVLETSAILRRYYRSPSGWPVLLTVVYAGTTRRSLHFPEVCLVGEGWEIREQTSAPVGILFKAKRLVLVRGDQQEAVLYWFKTGDVFTGNYFVNALHWARNQLAFGAPTSAMVKLTTMIGGAGEQASFAVLEDFAGKLAPILQKHVR